MSDQVVTQVVTVGNHGLPCPAALAGVAAAAGEFVALRVSAGAGAGVSRLQPSALLTPGDLAGGLGGVEAVGQLVHDVGGGVVLTLLTRLVLRSAVVQVPVGGAALQLRVLRGADLVDVEVGIVRVAACWLVRIDPNCVALQVALGRLLRLLADWHWNIVME